MTRRTTGPIAATETPRRVLWPAVLIAALALPTLLLVLRDAAALAPLAQWRWAFLSPDLDEPAQLLIRHAFLPRIAVALLAGAGLALAGTIMQHTLKNPLADPTTLGTAAGAGAALTVTTLFAPWLLSGGREAIAFAGASVATALTFALAARQSFSPITLILSGLVVTLLLGSLATTMMALKTDYLAEIFIWQSGSLLQNGYGAALGLAWRLVLAGLLAGLMIRPLVILGLDDQAAGALGLPPRLVRFLAVMLAVAVSASVVSVVGVIAFVGLAAPAIARLAGTRTLKGQLIVAPMIGGLLLLLTDRVVALIFAGTEVPAGAATAVFGAPLIFLLLPLVRRPLPAAQGALAAITRPPPLALVAALLLGLILVATLFGREWNGWGWISGPDALEILALRGPRVLAAASAGALLGTAGVLLQRVTGNPMASPEFLGVSGGATLGVVCLLLLTPSLNSLAVLAAASLGAGTATLFILALSARGNHAPERLLLMGISVATMATGLASLMLASGDPRTQWLQSWLAGSTYRATWNDALTAFVAALVVMACALPARRWLGILPLGDTVAGGLGIPVRRARVLIVCLGAAATAVATLTIGPLSFVGLMAPHLARMLGLKCPAGQLFGAALIGAAMLVGADWLGRTLIYPWQVPAGLLAAAMGAPVFAWLMRKRRALVGT